MKGVIEKLAHGLAAVITLASANAATQESQQPAGFGVLEIIEVTAQKRVEDAQDVPIAISAFTSTTLQDRNISTVQGLSNLTPNVSLDAGSPFSGSSSVLSAYIRGVGQDDFAFNLDPGVGVYIDGVYLARTVGANSDLLDVERIEILRGPQGTLFGRNSIGGAISIVTREPENELGGKLELVAGRFDRIDIRASLDLPFTDNLRTSHTFSSARRDGYLDRIPFPNQDAFIDDPVDAFPRSGFDRGDTEGGDDYWTLRSKLVWDANNNTRLTLMADYQDIDQEGIANSLLKVLANNGLPTFPGELFGSTYNVCINVPNNLLPTEPGNNLQAMCGPRGTVGTSFGNANVDADPNNDRLTFTDQFFTDDVDKSFATGPSFSRLDNWGIAATLEFDWSDHLSIKSISSYRELEWEASMDADGTPITIVEPGFKMNQEQFSEEIQFTGTALNGQLDYVLGFYYFEEKGDLHDFVPFGQGLLQVDGFNQFDTDTWAIFTHLNYALTDSLSLTLGARYTEEDKAFEGFQRDPNGYLYKLNLGVQLDEISETDRQTLGFPDPRDPLRFYPPGVNTKHFNNFSPRVGLEYGHSENVMVYISYSQGYKTGGWTTRLSFPEQTAPDFDEEEADSYELGLKSEWFDSRLRLNLAAFYTEYDGIQLTQTDGISPTTKNAGEARIHGAEIEFQAVPASNVTVNGGVGYIHDEYTQKDVGVTAGSALPKTPRWTVTISPQYTFNLDHGARVVALVDFTHTSEQFNNTENTPTLLRSQVNLVNASLIYENASDRWSVTLGGTNLNDERYLTTGQFQPGGGLIYGTYSRPEEWYVKLSVKF